MGFPPFTVKNKFYNIIINKMVCESDFPSIGSGIGLGILLFFSEILPFISTIEANGVVDFSVKLFLKYIESKKKQNEIIEEIGDIENNLHTN